MKSQRFALCLLALAAFAGTGTAGPPPSIVYILADDMGYGDVRALNPEGKIPTPHIDRLAREGMVFTDAHSGSAVCTPTRYGILTGRYAWRSRLKSGVLWGYSRRLVEPGRLTVAQFLREAGYATAAIGKWHLGMDWPLKGGGFADDRDRWDPEYRGGWDVEYSKPIEGGPNALGFEYFFGISASLDMPPFVFIRNDRALLGKLVEKTFIRSGPADAEFEATDVLPRLEGEAVAWIEKRAVEARSGRPFFLYLALSAPHTPIVPTPEWRGKSGLNPYGDFCMQVDAAVGRVLEALDAGEIAENTLVIFTADNGCAPQAGVAELEAKGHRPSYVYRGYKADIYEGGHRVPFIVRWPARVRAGSKSRRTICLGDLFATAAEILGKKLPAGVAEDSVSFLPALLGEDREPLREAIVHQSVDGSFAIRKGRWKLVLCPGSGGWSEPRPGTPEERGLPPIQLYDLETDPGERQNLQAEHPEIVAELKKIGSVLGIPVNSRASP